jgi:hypothetical protein
MSKLIILSVLAPFLITFPILSILELHYAYQLITDGASTTGTVVSYGSREVLKATMPSYSRTSISASKTKIVSFPVIEFSVQGKVFRAAGPYSDQKSFELGTKVPLRYLKSNPNQMLIESPYYYFMLFAASFLCLVIYSIALKIFSHESSVSFSISKTSTTKLHIGVVISILIGFLLITSGFISGYNRIKLFVHGKIYSGVVIEESKLETTSEIKRFLGMNIKSSHKNSRTLAEYADPLSGNVIQEYVLGYESNNVRYPGEPIEFLKFTKQKSIEVDLPWFFIAPLLLVSFGWAFCVTSYAYSKSMF